MPHCSQLMTVSRILDLSSGVRNSGVSAVVDMGGVTCVASGSDAALFTGGVWDGRAAFSETTDFAVFFSTFL